MYNLSGDKVHFINSYLKKAGVRYDDIRCEMTNHVATALEHMDGDFAVNFRNYMVNHKKELLDSSRFFRKLALRKAFMVLKNNSLKPQFFILALILFAVSVFARPYYGKDNVTDTLAFSMIAISSSIYFYFLYYKMFSKTNHSVIDRVLTIVYFGAIFFRLDKLIENTALVTLYYSFSIAFFVLLSQSLWQLNKQYKLRYNG